MATNDDLFELLSEIKEQLDSQEKVTLYWRRDIDNTLRAIENKVASIEREQKEPRRVN